MPLLKIVNSLILVRHCNKECVDMHGLATSHARYIHQLKGSSIVPNMEHDCLHTSNTSKDIFQKSYTNLMSPEMSLSGAVISLRFSLFTCCSLSHKALLLAQYLDTLQFTITTKLV